MEILRRTPWLRIRGQNSVDKEFRRYRCPMKAGPEFWRQKWKLQPTKRSKKNDDKSAVAMLIGMKVYGNLLSTTLKVTIDRVDLIRIVIKSWNEDLLNVDHLMHDNWVVYFRT